MFDMKKGKRNQFTKLSIISSADRTELGMTAVAATTTYFFMYLLHRKKKRGIRNRQWHRSQEYVDFMRFKPYLLYMA